MSTPRLTALQLLYAANDAQVALWVYRAWRKVQENPARGLPTPSEDANLTSPSAYTGTNN